MADFDIEMKGLEMFHENLEILERDFPKEATQMLRKVGNKGNTIIRRKARELVKKRSGNYLKSIKRGKVWRGDDGKYYVRVYTKSKIGPHAHLIEYGHRIVDKDGNEHGFADGYRVFEKGVKEMESQFEQILVSEFDKLMMKL